MRTCVRAPPLVWGGCPRVAAAVSTLIYLEFYADLHKGSALKANEHAGSKTPVITDLIH